MVLALEHYSRVRRADILPSADSGEKLMTILLVADISRRRGSLATGAREHIPMHEVPQIFPQDEFNMIFWPSF